MLTDMLLVMVDMWDGVEETAREAYEGFCGLTVDQKIMTGVMVAAGVAAVLLLPSERYPEE